MRQDASFAIINGTSRIEIFSDFISKFEDGARLQKIISYEVEDFPPNKSEENKLIYQAIKLLDSSKDRHENDCVECLIRLLEVDDEKNAREKVMNDINHAVEQAQNKQNRADVIRVLMKKYLLELLPKNVA